MHIHWSGIASTLALVLTLILQPGEVHAVPGTGEGHLTGIVITGSESFRGSLDVHRFRIDSGQLVADGFVSGRRALQGGADSDLSDLPITVPVKTVKGSCETLQVELDEAGLSGPASGVRVNPVQIAIPGGDSESLRGERVCGITEDLAQGAAPTDVVSKLNDLARFFR